MLNLYYRILFNVMKWVATAFAAVAAFIAVLAVADLTMQIGWGYTWVALVGASAMVCVGVVVRRLIAAVLRQISN